ncbi:MAG TPA: class I SAM-dependent methyltransferase [Candidatus Obscuribacterales bacterium]
MHIDDFSGPEAFLAELARRSWQPDFGLLAELLAANRRWPQAGLQKELLLLLQELAPGLQAQALLKELSLWLEGVLPALDSDLQPYAPWILACLRQKGWPDAREPELAAPPPQLFVEPLFTLLLRRCYLTDAGLEQELTRLRAALLLRSQKDPAWEPVLLSLAFQAWNNGYLWNETAAETARLEAMQSSQPLDLLTWACYRPLQTLLPASWQPWEQLSAGWRDLIAASVHAPAREKELAAEIPALTPLPQKDPCLAFYDQTPYPRWLAPERLAVEPLAEQLELILPNWDWRRRLLPGMQVLIAGCGTGQQLVQHGLQQPDARLSGLDLSRTALGYTARMLEVSGLQAELFQADLLELRHWPRRFDLIACGGVLHHLAEPEAGLANLVRLLKPGGLLKLGVYSHRARQPLLRLRTRLGVRGGESPAEVQDLRQRLLGDRSDEAKWVRRTRDFYTLPTCRDLLCHPRERTYTLPELATCFARQHLQVLGLELWNPQYYALYARRFPQDPQMLNLACWDLLEAEYPSLFAGMIVLWLGKSCE